MSSSGKATERTHASSPEEVSKAPSPDSPEARDSEAISLSRRIAAWVFTAVAAGFTGYLLYYYATGAAGPTALAVAMVPVAIALAYLNDARCGTLYPALGEAGGLAVALLYLGVLLAAASYLTAELDAIRVDRVGLWNAWDLLAGGAVAALVLEYTRRKYYSLFVVNVLLVLYAAAGPLMPGILHHGGFSWGRILSAVSVEMSTGVFERLAQLGLTLIGSFILVLSVLRGYEVIDAILKGCRRLSARSPRLLPQTAVVGSFGVAAVSGSGAANAATTGSATIPALIRAGFPRVRAAAVETASSIGGQLMPPLMGIAAFMMAELKGVGYFDVVARGFAPALIYFFGVAAAVHLLATRYQSSAEAPDAEPMRPFDWVRIAGYLLALAALIALMGVMREPAMRAAQMVFFGLLIGFGALSLLAWLRQSRRRARELVRPLERALDTFATTTSELTVLLSTLGILTAAFTITGVPTAVGDLVMDLADVHVALMILVAFAFGYLVGMGLPVAPTYVVVAVVVGPPMVSAGFDPWVVHFFAFFVAVFGELSPPASVTAAVTSKIADAPFVRTMFAALSICLPLLLMTAGVFARPELVLEPGWGQLAAAALVAVAVLGVTGALQGRMHSRAGIDRALRALLAGCAAMALFHPSQIAAAGAAGLVLVGLIAAWRMPARTGRAA